MLIDLCNLHLSMFGRTLAGSARIIAEGCTKNLRPYYIYENELFKHDSHADDKKKDWAFDVNVLNYFSFSCNQIISYLEKPYLSTITAFTLKHLVEGAEENRLSQCHLCFT